MSDDELWGLVERIKKENDPLKRDALETEMLNEIDPRIIRFLKSYFAAVDHEAIAHDTELAFLKKIPGLVRKDAQLMSIVLLIAKRKAVDAIRSSPDVANIEWTEEVESQIKADVLPDERRAEKIALVREMLSKLERKEKELYILRYFEGMKYGEIAEVVGRSESAVRMEISRAKEKVKKMFRKLQDES